MPEYIYFLFNLTLIPNNPVKDLKVNALAPEHYNFHLLQLIGFSLVLITVSILPIGQTQTPHRQDAVHVVSDPGMWEISTSW